MTAENEARRLALSTAIAQINAAIDALRKIVDLDCLPPRLRTGVFNASYELHHASVDATERLDALKQQALAATPKEHR